MRPTFPSLRIGPVDLPSHRRVGACTLGLAWLTGVGLLLSACTTSRSAAVDALSMPVVGSEPSVEGAPAVATGTLVLATDTATPFDVAAGSGDGSQGRPDEAEIAYAKATAAGIFRRRASQRSTRFVAVDGDGYGLCLRSPARSGRGYDHALIVFARRLNGQPISQVDDDTIVYRRPADAAPCRRAAIDWTPLVG